MMDFANSRIFVAGHRGLVGSAIVRALMYRGCPAPIVRTRQEVDLTKESEVDAFFLTHKPEYVFLAAAKVGGIVANDRYPADFIRENLAIQLNVIHAAYRHAVKKLLVLGSSCIYPRLAPQPIREEYLLSGPLEPTNEAYAIAKIAGIRMAQSYRKQYGLEAVCVMPTNLYGPNDNYDPETSHVLPALIRKFAEAKAADAPRVVLWGSGQARREFLHVDDLADACLFLMNNYSGADIVNVGTGQDIRICEVAEMIREIAGYEGQIVYDNSKPDGTPRKLLDVQRLTALGWRARISLREGVTKTYEMAAPQFAESGQVAQATIA
jgi:GDP-L-fucose synthase